MGEWNRNTPWRQGSVLSAQDAIKLGLLAGGSTSRICIVASHDCDIACERLIAEPTVEFLVGALIEKVDGAYTRAKNARTLHLEFQSPDGRKAASFSIRDRVEVDKTRLADFVPDLTWSHISPKALVSLRWWLAARYFRSSFPDSFETRLSRSKLNHKIDQLLTPLGETVHGIFFLVDDGADEGKADAEPHELRAVIVYDASADETQIEAAEAAAKKIEGAFRAKLFDPATGVWRDIELVSCECVSDEVFSFAHMRAFKQWRLEFRSLDDDAQTLPVLNV